MLPCDIGTAMSELRPVAVDELQYSDLRPYRVRFLSRISESGLLALTVWHGKPTSGIGAPSFPPEHLPVPDRRVRNVFWPWGKHRIMWQQGALAVLRSESSVVVCVEVIHSLTVWLIALTHRVFGKRLVLRGYFYRPGNGHAWSRRTAGVRRFLHRRADAYIAYTHRGRAELLAAGITPDRIFVSQNTLDTEALMMIAEEVAPSAVVKLRDDMTLGRGPVLLYLGKLIPVKRVDVAIELLARLEVEASLIIVGDGFLRGELVRMSHGLPVRFRGAIYDESELAGYFKLADLLVLPGRVGLTCVHGFANGVPCVTTTEEVVEQSPEYAYLEHDYNSLILPNTDPAIHAKAVRDLLEDRYRMDRLRKGAIETAERLKMGRMVEQYEQAVLKAVGP